MVSDAESLVEKVRWSTGNAVGARIKSRDVNKTTYMGFSQSAEEKMIRANAMAAFSDNEEERQKKLKEFEQLKAKVDREKKKEEK